MFLIDYRPTNITDRDEGISDVEDATELKLLLELSEQVIKIIKCYLDVI